jgi:hypothetical protein
VYRGFTNHSYDSAYDVDATNIILSSGYASNFWAGKTTEIARQDGADFDLISMKIRNDAYATGVTIQGFDDGDLVHEEHRTVSTNWDPVVLNWLSIDQVKILVAGTYGSGGGWIGYDDMVFVV